MSRPAHTAEKAPERACAGRPPVAQGQAPVDTMDALEAWIRDLLLGLRLPPLSVLASSGYRTPGIS